MNTSTLRVVAKCARSTLIPWVGLALVTPISAQRPDLIVNRPRLASSVELQTRGFPASDCAIVEGCVQAGTRKLLLFEVTFVNIGVADLVIGNPADNPDLFIYSPCHDHAHMQGAASYDLFSSSGRLLITSRKQAFCFRDNEPYFSNAGSSGGYDCDYQGISAGWQDVYHKGLECQWLDVTGLPGGTYMLRITVNPEGRFEESNYANNTASVTVELPGTPPPVTPPPTTPITGGRTSLYRNPAPPAPTPPPTTPTSGGRTSLYRNPAPPPPTTPTTGGRTSLYRNPAPPPPPSEIDEPRHGNGHHHNHHHHHDDDDDD